MPVPVLFMRVRYISAFHFRLLFLVNMLPVLAAHILIFRLSILLFKLSL